MGTPVERAVRDAVRDALQELQLEYPDAGALPFDQAFLEGRGASVLARFLVPGTDPSADDLLEACRAEVSDRDGGRPEGAIGALATDLLRLFDSALDAPDRQKTLRELRAYRAQRSIVDATSRLVAWADSQRRRASVDPHQRYDELDLARFVGREWLVKQVDGFLRSRDSGYFVFGGRCRGREVCVFGAACA